MESLGCLPEQDEVPNDLNRYRWRGSRKCMRRYEPSEAARKHLDSSEQKEREKNMAAMLDNLNKRDGVRTHTR